MNKYVLTSTEEENLKFYQKLGYNYIVLCKGSLLLSEEEPLQEPLPYGGCHWSGQGKWQHVVKINNLFDFLHENECLPIQNILFE